MRVGLCALLCLAVLALRPGPARAADGIVIEVAPSARPPADARLVDRVAELAHGGRLRGESLRAAILASGSTPGTPPEAASFEELQRLVDEGMADFYNNRFPQAVERLTRAGQALQANLDLVAREEPAAAALFESQMILAVLLRRDGREEAARQIVRQVVQTFPDRRPMLSQFAPEVVGFFDQTRAQMEAAPKARLSVATAPVPCAVLLDGRSIGVSPLSERILVPGAYALQLRCEGRLTRVRRVRLGPGPVALRFEVEAELALRTDPVPWIVAGPYAHRAAAELGRQLSVETVTLVERRGDRLVVERMRAEDGTVLARGSGADAAAAVTAMRAVPDGSGHDSRATPAPWSSDWAAWATLGVGVLATGAGLLLVQGAREDADAALDQPTAAARERLGDDARARGVPGTLLFTTGIGLALGGLGALAVPPSDHPGALHGPLFWALAGLGLGAVSAGAGALLLDECAWPDHALCPAVYGERLGSAGPAPALLLGGGLVVLGTAVVLRALEEG